jgi:hypothetical protein
VFPVRYELGFYISEDDILSHRGENLTQEHTSSVVHYKDAWPRMGTSLRTSANGTMYIRGSQEGDCILRSDVTSTYMQYVRFTRNGGTVRVALSSSTG